MLRNIAPSLCFWINQELLAFSLLLNDLTTIAAYQNVTILSFFLLSHSFFHRSKQLSQQAIFLSVMAAVCVLLGPILIGQRERWRRQLEERERKEEEAEFEEEWIYL